MFFPLNRCFDNMDKARFSFKKQYFFTETKPSFFSKYRFWGIMKQKEKLSLIKILMELMVIVKSTVQELN